MRNLGGQNRESFSESRGLQTMGWEETQTELGWFDYYIINQSSCLVGWGWSDAGIDGDAGVGYGGRIAKGG